MVPAFSQVPPSGQSVSRQHGLRTPATQPPLTHTSFGAQSAKLAQVATLGAEGSE